MQTAEALYTARIVDRQCFLDEAYKSAKLTIPALFPDNQDIIQRSTPVELPKPFQSLGSRGVNNLASKLLLTLFPPTAPFMKYVLSGQTKEEAGEAGAELSDLMARLSRREARIQDEVDLQNIRVKAFLLLKHLLVAGNVLVYKPDDEDGLQVFTLSSYVCNRDGRGNLLDLIYVEKLDKDSIEDPRVLEILANVPDAGENKGINDNVVLLYTRVQRKGKKFESWQEVNGTEVPDSHETFSKKSLPWLVLRYTSVDGEDYGRGFVEEYRGDLTSYEQLSRDILFASANAAKVVWALDPNSGVSVAKFIEAPNGGAIRAKGEDIVALRLDKGGDMSVAFQHAQELKSALSADFLLNSSFQRHQERVTAEEIRRMAEELEDTLGGVFSLMSQELQLPLAFLLEEDLIRKDPTFKRLPEGTVRIGVVTGLAAIGRGQENQRFREALLEFAEAANVFPGLKDWVKEEDVNNRIWTGKGVDTQGLFYTEEEVSENRQAAQQAAAVNTLGTEAARGAGNAIGGLDPNTVAESLAPQE